MPNAKHDEEQSGQGPRAKPQPRVSDGRRNDPDDATRGPGAPADLSKREIPRDSVGGFN